MKLLAPSFLLLFCSFYSALAQCDMDLMLDQDGRVLLSQAESIEFIKLINNARPYFSASLADSTETMTFEILSVPDELKATFMSQSNLSLELTLDALGDKLIVQVFSTLGKSTAHCLNLRDQTV